MDTCTNDSSRLNTHSVSLRAVNPGFQKGRAHFYDCFDLRYLA